MWFYLIFMWLLGIGLAYSFHNADKRLGVFKKRQYWGYPIFVFLVPFVLPILIGLAIGDYLTDTEDEHKDF